METTTLKTTVPGAAAAGFAAMVNRAYSQQQVLTGNKGMLQSIIAAHFAQMSATGNLWKRDTFKALLLHLYEQRCFSVVRMPDYIDVLAAMSSFGNKLVRDVAAWQKTGSAPEEQLASLIRHCFAKYPVPQFMEHVFAVGNKIHMLWYIQLGRGDSVLALSAFPVKFTNRMSHFFRLTPAGYTVNQAIRRAQALGYGAAIDRAEMMAWSMLAESFEHETFWAGVIQFISNAEDVITLDKLQAVLQYIESLRMFQPQMSMQGRTWAALLRQAEEWHAEQAKRRAEEDRLYWPKSGIGALHLEKDGIVYTTVELTDSDMLYEEGAEMSHCVASYDYDCYHGNIAIFSLRCYTKGEEGFTRLATVDVSLREREIVEAKGKYNAYVTDDVQALLVMWAEKEHLALVYDYEDGFYEPAPVVVQRPQAEAEPAWIWLKLAFFIVLISMKMCSSNRQEPVYRFEKMPDGSVRLEQFDR
jgi:hypothetical protein